MLKNLPKFLQDNLSKIKKPIRGALQFSLNSFSSSKKWIFSKSYCKHPKTLSIAIDRDPSIHETSNDQNDSATLADIDRFLFENFKSLYIKDDKEEVENNQKDKDHLRNKISHDQNSGEILFDSSRFMNLPSDLRGSNRFFVTPGFSSSLIDEARMSITASSEDAGGSTSTLTTNGSMLMNSNNNVTLPDDSIAILRYSLTPYDDFRYSMQQMVEVRLRHHDGVDWNFMEELLFCYLNLNEKNSYKFILSAFVDLIVALRQNSNRVSKRSRNLRSTRQRRRETREREGNVRIWS